MKYYTKVSDGGICYQSDLYWGVKVAGEVEFDNYDDAVKAAKKTARKTGEDVVIYAEHSVVKFPESDFEVEKLV